MSGVDGKQLSIRQALRAATNGCRMGRPSEEDAAEEGNPDPTVEGVQGREWPAEEAPGTEEDFIPICCVP